MLIRTINYLFVLLLIVTFLTGCPGGGGGSGEKTKTQVAKVVLTVLNNYQPANGETLITIAVGVRDANNAPLPNISVSIVSSSATAFFVASSEKTDDSGLQTVNFFDTIAETFEVKAIAEGVTSLPLSLTFITPTNAIDLKAEEQILQIVDMAHLTVITRQKSSETGANSQQGNAGVPLPNAPIDISVSGAAVVSGEVPKTTDAHGQATFTVSDKTRETVTVTVKSGAVMQTLLLYFGATLSLLPKESVNVIEKTTLTALLRDSSNAPIAGQTVKFNFIGNSNENLSPTVATTDANGIAQVVVTDMEKNGGMVVVNARLGTVNASAMVNFLAVFGQDRQLEVFTTAKVLSKGQKATITARITDKNKLPIAGQQVKFASVLTAGGGLSHTQFLPQTGISNNQGEVQTEVANPSEENVMIIVQADTARQEIPVYFGASLTLLPSTATGIADGTTPVKFTATVVDALGVGIPGIAVNFHVPSQQVVLDKTPVLSDESGRAVVSVSDYLPETVTLQASADNVKSGTASLTFLAPGMTIELKTTDKVLPVNATAQVTIITTQTANEVKGAPLPQAPLTVTLSGQARSKEAVPLTTNGSGKATLTITDELAEKVLVTVQSGSVTQTLTLYFGATLSLLPVSGSAVETTTLTALLKDGQGVPIGGEMVSFSLVGNSQKTLTPTTAPTTADGTAQVTVTDLGKEKGETIIKVSSGPLSAQATVTFKDNLLDERVASVKLSVTNDNQPADGKSAITVTVIARDGQNAPVTGVPVSLLSSSDTAFFEVLSGKTEENGRFTTTVTNSVAEPVTITPTAGGVKGQPVIINFVSGAIDPRVATVKMTVTNNFQPTDGKSAVTLTVIARDAANVPIPNVQVYLVSPSDTALFEAVSGKTEENGRFSTKVTDSVAETIEVSATAGGVKASPVTITFVSSAVDTRVATVKLMVSNNFQRADGVSKVTLTAVALDKNNMPTSGVVVSFSSTSTSAFLEKFSGTTDETGRFSTTVTDNVAEEFKVTATAGGVRSELMSVTFAAAVGRIVINASGVVLDVGNTSKITVTLLNSVNIEEVLREFVDFFNSVTKEVEKATLDALLERKILLPNTPVSVAVSGAAVVNKVATSTDAYGQATFTVTDNTAEDVTLTVTSGDVSQTMTLHFGASLSLIPNSINAIGSTKLKVLLTSGNKTPLAGQTVNFNFINATNETLSPVSVTTSADGTAEVTITDLGNDGGNVVVRASSGQLATTATVNFLADIGQGRHFEANTSATLLGTGEPATITARVKDGVDQPVSEIPINFLVALANGEKSSAQLLKAIPANSVTDKNGKVQVTVLDNVKENVVVTVQAGTAIQKILLYVGATVNIIPQGAIGTADGKTPVTLTANVKDANGAGIKGAVINFHATGDTKALLDVFRATTDDVGQAAVKVTNTAAEDTTVEARTDNLSAKATIKFSFIGSGNPATIILTTDKPEPVTLALNETVTITAKVLDSQNIPVKDGSRIDFATSNDIGTVTQSVFTKAGQVEAIFNAGTKAGLASVTATASVPYSYQPILFAGAGLSIIVEPSHTAGIIEVYKVDPKEIGVIGSGVTQTATLQFMVKDNLGNPVKDGTTVDFTLGKTTLGGGETITTGEGNDATNATGKTNNGIASVTLKSGTVAGTIDVIAKVGKISTVARVIIVSSLPDADHLSLAAQFLNISGGVKFGLLDNITAYVGDRFGNVVPDGTSVSFITEGGTIGKSIGKEAFTTTTEFGQAVATLQSANPMTPYLGGVPSLRIDGYKCSDNYQYVSPSSVSQNLCSNPGLVTIVAYTTGSESYIDVNGSGRFDVGIDRFSDPGYIDANGNKKWDLGEIITGKGDMSEPYIDANDNQTYDPGELYIDVNHNGQFDGPDGVFQGNTTVWTSFRVLFSAPTAPIIVTPTTFAIANGGGEFFTVTNVSDLYGNALVKGTKFQVTANNGVLGGVGTMEPLSFNDSNSRGEVAVQFTLSSNPPQRVTEKDADGNETTVFKYPPQDSATITITIKSPLSENAPGGNGDVAGVISGSINVSSP
jgi:adhesin/invasin